MTASITPGYKQTEVGVIPADWKVRAVASMGEVRAGKALAVRGPGQLRPYLRTKNVFDGRIDIDDVLEMPMTDAEFALYRLRHGDVLLNEGQSIELVGRCAMYQDEFPQPCGIQNQLVRFRAFENTSAKFATHLFRRCQTSGIFSKIAMQTTSVAHLGVSRFQQLRLAWPPTKTEQEAIAGALSDADGLIESLEKLVAKKRQIKHGTMQELLTGKRRLPGFSRKWETKRLGEIGDFYSGGTPNTAIAEYYGGDIPWITSSDCNTPRIQSVAGRITEAGVRSSATKWIKSGTVLMALYGATAGVVAISEINATINQAVLAIVLSGADSEFMFQKLRMMKEWIIATYTQGGQPNLSGAIVKSIELTLPPLREQSAIAAILSDMDSEIAALDAKLAKARQIKQGMMQELLTGRIRLLLPTATTQQSSTAASAVSGKKTGHNRQIEEAVVIGILAKTFGNEQYPLARKRRVKLTYLLDRHATGKADGYLKKAAGPYNPATKYKGPEAIAVKNGYVREHNNGAYPGFVAGEDIAKAEAYFRQWYRPDALKWLEQFRYLKTDDLELLATVDMAMEDLRREMKAVNLTSVKAVIKSHPEWEAKLERDVFSDTNISRAITRCSELFAAAAGSA